MSIIDFDNFISTYANKTTLIIILWTCSAIFLGFLFTKRKPNTKMVQVSGEIEEEEEDINYVQDQTKFNPNSTQKFPEDYPRVPYKRKLYSVEEMEERSKQYFQMMNERRSIRDFSSNPFPFSIIENCIKTAGTAPSGAHTQPWTFVVVSDPQVKQQIRDAAEDEEKINYSKRMSAQWKKDLAPLGTTWEKPHITDAPYLIVVFKQIYGLDSEGNRTNNYYFDKSVGIATGMLLAALHQAGLSTLTHTPEPMGFLTTLLGRKTNEKPYLLIPVGFPSPTATVPDLKRKPLSEIMVHIGETK